MKKLPFPLLIFSLFITPYFYSVWWKFIPVTCLLILSFWLFLKKETLSYLGLKFKSKDFATAIGLGISIFFAASFLVPGIAEHQGYKTTLLPDAALWRFGLFFQCLNEEMIFRAVLLNFFLKRKVSKLWLIVFPAFLFSAMHGITAWSAEQTVLTFFCYLTLFFFGSATNLLFLSTRNIASVTCIHWGWNALRFSLAFSGPVDLKAWGSFNLIEGHPLALVLAVVLSLLLLLGNKKALRL